MIEVSGLRFDTVEPEKEITIKFEKGVGVIIINPERFQETVLDFIFCKDDMGEASNTAITMALFVQVLKNPKIIELADKAMRAEIEKFSKIQ